MFVRQYVAEIGYDMVSPTRPHRLPPRYRLRHPVDIREGLSNAYTVLTEVSANNTPINDVIVNVLWLVMYLLRHWCVFHSMCSYSRIENQSQGPVTSRTARFDVTLLYLYHRDIRVSCF